MPIMPDLAERLHLHPVVETEHRAAQDPVPDPGRPQVLPDRHHRRGAGADRSGRWSTPTHGPPTSSGPGTSSRCWPRRGASSAAPATPRRPSTSPGSPGLAPAGVLIEILDGTGRASREKLHEIARRVRPADRLDRGADPLPPTPREARPPRRRGRPADPLRPGPDHRLQRRPRAGQRAGRHRHGRPQAGRGPARPAALLLLHRRPARVAPLRLRRPAPHGPRA